MSKPTDREYMGIGRDCCSTGDKDPDANPSVRDVCSAGHANVAEFSSSSSHIVPDILSRENWQPDYLVTVRVPHASIRASYWCWQRFPQPAEWHPNTRRS